MALYVYSCGGDHGLLDCFTLGTVCLYTVDFCAQVLPQDQLCFYFHSLTGITVSVKAVINTFVLSTLIVYPVTLQHEGCQVGLRCCISFS